ncbi:hypothetical protein N7453_006722 [Penicillium expansum]|nr:hypothetical protein N7453_006722 [Penicillium expansum]
MVGKNRFPDLIDAKSRWAELAILADEESGRSLSSVVSSAPSLPSKPDIRKRDRSGDSGHSHTSRRCSGPEDVHHGQVVCVWISIALVAGRSIFAA